MHRMFPDRGRKLLIIVVGVRGCRQGQRCCGGRDRERRDIELDKRTGYLDCFTHAGGKQARSPELKRNLIAVLLAYSTNLGLTNMAQASGISYDILAWTAEWYVREETLRAANLALIGYHQRLPLTAAFGTGPLSSSDGQRVPTRGKSTTARAVNLSPNRACRPIPMSPISTPPTAPR
jgi:hypothetical protein